MAETHSYPFLFLLVPIVIFGPILGLVLWMFGIKSLFQHSPVPAAEAKKERKETRRQAALQHENWHPTPLMWVWQTLAYGTFAVGIGFFSAHPSYHHADEANGQIKLSLSHPGQHKVACRERKPAELAALPPNMRSARACERERLPVTVTLVLDSRVLFTATVLPAGLSRDGASSFYETFLIPAGSHHIAAQLDDGGAAVSFDQVFSLVPRQILALGFAEGRFFVK